MLRSHKQRTTYLVKKVSAYLSIFVLCLAAFGMYVKYLGISYTYTGSLPVGFYRQTSGDISKGSIVSFNPVLDPTLNQFLSRFYHHGTTHEWMKRVVGLPGDIIDISSTGNITVNGQVIPNSKWFPIQAADGAILDTPPTYPIIIQPGQVFLLGTHPQSLDSRFYGPVPKNIITAINVPILVWSVDDIHV